MENKIYGIITFSPIKNFERIIWKKGKLRRELPFHRSGKSILVTIESGLKFLQKTAFESIAPGKTVSYNQKSLPICRRTLPIRDNIPMKTFPLADSTQ
jgi:hypothetical protein